jgi:flagellar motility protein MotE (MotC chaperone)
MKFLFIALFVTFSSQGMTAEKKYTEAEFRQAVIDAVGVELRRLGREQIVQLSRELLQKEEDLRLRELQMRKKDEEIKLTERTLQERVVAFHDAQKNFLACVDQVSKEQNNRVQHLVESIAGMRPQNAADVLSVQDPEISVQILGMLEPDRVARIFNLMDKEVSARLQKQYLNMKK